MSNRTMALAFAVLVSSGSLCALAAETTKHETALPPDAVPGIPQGHLVESKEEKANKKGEESAGSNSGADSQSMEKEAASSSDSEKK